MNNGERFWIRGDGFQAEIDFFNKTDAESLNPVFVPRRGTFNVKLRKSPQDQPK